MTGKGSPTVPKDSLLTGKVLPAVRKGSVLIGKGLPVVRKGCALIAEGIQAVQEANWFTEEASPILRDVVALGVDGLTIVREGFPAVAPTFQVARRGSALAAALLSLLQEDGSFPGIRLSGCISVLPSGLWTLSPSQELVESAVYGHGLRPS